MDYLSRARWRPAGAWATGWRSQRGSVPGERIAMSGTFLIDSESRMELAAAGMVGTLAKDPVCGVDVSVNKAEKGGKKKQV